MLYHTVIVCNGAADFQDWTRVLHPYQGLDLI